MKNCTSTSKETCPIFSNIGAIYIYQNAMLKLDKNNLKGRALFLGERLDLHAFWCALYIGDALLIDPKMVGRVEMGEKPDTDLPVCSR